MIAIAPRPAKKSAKTSKAGKPRTQGLAVRSRQGVGSGGKKVAQTPKGVATKSRPVVQSGARAAGSGGGTAVGQRRSRSPLQVRRDAFFDRPIDYIPCRDFLRKDAERLASTPPAEAELPLARDRRAGQSGADGPISPYIARLYDSRLLTKEEEQFYFRRMNWLRFHAATARGKLDRRRATIKQMQRIEATLNEADDVKSLIITSNLRLVVSIAKKFVSNELAFEDLVSEGNLALMRSVEKFNFALGNRFSTYATYAIQRHFFRLSQRSRKQWNRFVSDDAALHAVAVAEPDGEQCTASQVDVLKQTFGRFLEELEPREKQIVVARFGFDGQAPRTFRELGSEMGVCKERIRQIQGRAMDKLRELANEAKLGQTVGDWL